MNYHYPLETVVALTRNRIVRWLKYRDNNSYTEYEGKDTFHKNWEWCMVYDKNNERIFIRLNVNDKLIFNRSYQLEFFPDAYELLLLAEDVTSGQYAEPMPYYGDECEIDNYIPEFCKRRG